MPRYYILKIRCCYTLYIYTLKEAGPNTSTQIELNKKHEVCIQYSSKWTILIILNTLTTPTTKTNLTTLITLTKF